MQAVASMALERLGPHASSSLIPDPPTTERGSSSVHVVICGLTALEGIHVFNQMVWCFGLPKWCSILLNEIFDCYSQLYIWELVQFHLAFKIC